MGSAASKGARRLPKTAPTTTRAAPAAPRPPPEANTEAQAQPRAAPRSDFEYGGMGRETAAGPKKSAEAPFSGEKDERILQDAMDPQFMANLQKMGQVHVASAPQLAPSRAQRTLSARKKEYTSPTAVPPPGTATMAMMTELLDTLKTLPPHADPEPWYKHYGLRPEDMAAIRRWVNSPSVDGTEKVTMSDGQNQTVQQNVEMKAIWVDGRDKGARKI